MNLVLYINSQYLIHHNKMVFVREKITIMWTARCLLFEKKSPKSFWCEALNTTVYLLNRLVTKTVEDMAPIEAWLGQKLNFDHLKIFAFVCLSMFSKQKGQKLMKNYKKEYFLVTLLNQKATWFLIFLKKNGFNKGCRIWWRSLMRFQTWKNYVGVTMVHLPPQELHLKWRVLLTLPLSKQNQFWNCKKDAMQLKSLQIILRLLNHKNDLRPWKMRFHY